jgi:hypothetical protein
MWIWMGWGTLKCKMATSSNEYQHGRPSEGMCCLCTMEDITEEDQNYGEDVDYLVRFDNGIMSKKRIPSPPQ